MSDPSGEIVLNINDKDYTMKPSFKFLTRVEDLLDRPITQVVMELVGGHVRYGHMAIVIQQGIIAAGGQPPAFNDIGEWLRRTPPAEVAGPVSRMLTEALHSGPKPS
jgi:hypothetical protein